MAQSDDCKLLMNCPFMQRELIRKGTITLDDLTDAQLETLFDNTVLEDWLDGQQVMQMLHISPRTLQTLRTNGTLPFSRICNKLYYRRQDIQGILRNNYVMYKLHSKDQK